jgi:hypothetical protein
MHPPCGGIDASDSRATNFHGLGSMGFTGSAVESKQFVPFSYFKSTIPGVYQKLQNGLSFLDEAAAPPRTHRPIVTGTLYISFTVLYL